MDSATPPHGKAPTSVVERAMAQLREKILASEPGALMGSEASLMAELNVSRTTLRQIYRVLEQHELLTIRRGSGGGFFARRPDISSIVGVATTWLMLNGANMDHLFDMARLLSSEAAMLAARSKADKSAFAQVLQQLREVDLTDRAERLRLGDRYLDRKLDLAGNPALTLFLKSLYSLGYNLPQFSDCDVIDDQARGRELRDLRLQIGQAILAGDAERAGLLSRQVSKLGERWRA